MTHEPVATVIVLGHNNGRFLERCFEAILDQTLPAADYEVIYADNGSTDGSLEAMSERYPAVRTLSFGENLGFAEGNNRAAAEARTPYLVFLNPDVLVHRAFLATIVCALDQFPDIAACQANVLMPWQREFAALDREGYPTRIHVMEMTSWGFVEYLEMPMSNGPIPVRFVSGGCFALRHDVLPGLRYLFDPRFFMYSEDLDLSLRLAVLGCRMATIPGAVAYHQHHVDPLPGRRDVVRAYRATRNRLLAYYKSTPPGQFRRLLPRLVLGAPLKAFQVGRGTVRQTALAFLMIPIVAAAAAAALVASHHYREERELWLDQLRVKQRGASVPASTASGDGPDP